MAACCALPFLGCALPLEWQGPSRSVDMPFVEQTDKPFLANEATGNRTGAEAMSAGIDLETAKRFIEKEYGTARRTVTPSLPASCLGRLFAATPSPYPS